MVCSVQSSMISIKCLGADSSAFAGAGVVHNVDYAACRVQCAAFQR